MKKIEIIATGGTIAGSDHMGKTTNYKAGSLSVEDLLASIPDIKSEFGISLFPLLSVDSNEMNITHWIALKKKIDEISSEFDGIVITHGTDTIEETAYSLTLTINTD
jgi:L-asparaginase